MPYFNDFMNSVRQQTLAASDAFDRIEASYGQKNICENYYIVKKLDVSHIVMANDEVYDWGAQGVKLSPEAVNELIEMIKEEIRKVSYEKYRGSIDCSAFMDDENYNDIIVVFTKANPNYIEARTI